MKRQWYMTAHGSDMDTALVGEKLKDVVRDLDGASVDVTLEPISEKAIVVKILDEVIRVFIKGDPHLMGSTCSCCAEKRTLVLELRGKGFDV